MKIGEIWKYKQWVVRLIDNNLYDYNDNADFSPTSQVRVRITKINRDIVWFMEYKSQESEHNIKREAFVQIFEKVYE